MRPYNNYMDFIRALEAAWQPIIASIGVVVWLVRLEGKIKSCEDANYRHERWQEVMDEKHSNLDSKIVDQLGQIRESLARLEGKLGVQDRNV